jgi:surfeit locus 1 family protein
MNWTFRPTLWGSLGLLISVPLFISLGLWQAGRGAEKEHMARQQEEFSRLPPLRLAADAAPFGQHDLRWRKAEAEGHYLDHLHILLDNQLQQGQAGYKVYTAFAAGDKALIWVERGWIAVGNRDHVPQLSVDSTATTRLRGTLVSPPSIGLRLAGETVEMMNPQVMRVGVLDIAQLNQRLGIAAAPLVLQLEEPADPRFTPTHSTPGSGAQKHYGYAFQWFSFAAAVIIIYLVTGLKRRGTN